MRANRIVLAGLGTMALVLATGTPLPAQHVHPGTGNVYFSCRAPMSFAEARALAAIYGGHLVVIGSAAENAWITSWQGFWQSYPEGIWIGLTDEDVEGTFVWETGEPLTYTTWATGQPGSGDYVGQIIDGSPPGPLWIASSGSVQRRALVEIPAPATLLPAVEFDRTIDGAEHQLSWTGGGGFDTFRVYRDLELIATLPASASSYVDVPPSSSGIPTYILIAEAAGVLTVPASTVTRDLAVEEVSGVPGGTVTVDVTIENHGAGIQGWSYGVCSDASIAVPATIGMGDTATLNLGGIISFNERNTYPGGFTQAAVICAYGCAVIPAGSYGVVAAVAEYEIAPTAPVGSGTTLEFCGTLGAPAVQVVIVVGSASLLPDRADPGAIHVTDVTFVRGDSNGDGTVNIADPIALETWLFAGAAQPPCLEACEANDDALIDIADVIYVLTYLFSQGLPPAPGPFPACGVDPEPATSHGCLESPDCP